MAWDYTAILREHFLNPKNFLDVDEKEYNADGIGYVGSPECGDYMKVFLKIENDKIKDFKWETYGCASAIASTSILSEIAIGMNLDEAFDITPEVIANKLGGLPAAKVHCSVLGDKAMKAAINDYFKKNNMNDRIREKEEVLVCTCLNLMESDIEHAVLHGATTFEKLQQATKIGTACGKCIGDAKNVMNDYIKKYNIKD